MRNFKTALSVLVCLAFYRLIGSDGSFMAATAAIICMQSSVEESVASGLSRIQGTAVGAVIGMGLLYLDLAIPRYDLLFFLAPVGIMIVIVLCNAMNRSEAIVIACVVLLVILLQHTDLPPFLYSVRRLADTLVGILVSIGINLLIRKPAATAAEPAQTEDSQDVDSHCEENEKNDEQHGQTK